MEAEQTELSLDICVGQDGGQEGYVLWPKNLRHHYQEGSVPGTGSCLQLPRTTLTSVSTTTLGGLSNSYPTSQRGWVQ